MWGRTWGAKEALITSFEERPAGRDLRTAALKVNPRERGGRQD
jgi:hypothetical protein